MSKNISSKTGLATTTSSFHANHARQRILQNYLLIWIDANIDESKQDFQNDLAQLRRIVNDINIFTQRDEGIDFLTKIVDMKAFLIVEGTTGQQIVPLIHDIPQLDAICIFRGNQSPHEQSTKKYTKIKGVYTEIQPICEALQLAAKQCNQNSIAMSFVSMNESASSQNLDQLEPSFMYTQIFKEILLEMEYDEQSMKDFVQFWRLHYINNIVKQKDIAELERDYRPQSAIAWYTRECFVYEMLNRALRTLEADTIINMRFFVRDMQQQIQQLYQKQVASYNGRPFTVYRGQGLVKTDFEKLMKSKGGLMSFNNFLSTSEDSDVSRVFAESALTKTDTVGILFKMTIDPSISSAPFASIREVSYYKTEEEILFSMHTVFRIGEINKMDNNDSLYQVDLKLTADDDQQLRTLTKRIREEVKGTTGWRRLGYLLLKLSQFDKAEELYNVLLEQTSGEGDKALYYNQLGYIKNDQGDYDNAIEYYEKACEIFEKTLPSNHLSLAASYNNIGLLSKNMGKYSKALSFYEKALKIRQKALPPNHSDFAQTYNNIATVYSKMGEYPKALSFYEKTREIFEKTLPSNHPSLATFYNNIGGVYDNMEEYLKALSFYEKALQIQQKALLSNHPDLATSYNNIAVVYDKTGEYSKALSFHEKALEIWQKTLPPNHPHLATFYNNIAGVHCNMGEYPRALSFYEKTREIFEKTLLSNHPSLATSYNNIGGVYFIMGEFSKALTYFERALNLFQSSLSANHPNIKSVQENIEFLKRNCKFIFDK